MRTIAKGILTTIFVVLAISIVFGQKGAEDGSRFGHGEDSIRCIKNLSLYREYAKQKNYELALEPWIIVYSECPKATKYIYIDGIKMISGVIKKEQDTEQKKVLIDSMMRIHDKRMKNYNEKGKVLGYKGLDFLKYSERNAENFKIGYSFLKKSIELQKYKSSAPAVLTCMQTSSSLFKAGEIEGEQVVEDYSIIYEIAEYVITNKKKGWQNMEKAKPSIDKIFEESGAAQCENLVPLYTKKFEETPEGIEFLNKSTTLLRATGCNEEKLFFALINKLNSLAPTADLASELAKLSNKNKKLEEAARYYKQAIELEVDDKRKANFYLELGDVIRRLGNLSQARTYALNSIELDPASGYPYLLIGNIYAAASKTCGEEEFHQKAVYWVAVDKFLKAKTIDPELTENANKFIETYRPHFPDNETIFFYNYKQGDIYTVGCWINEKTKVRAR